mgnify:FL=1
MLGIFLASPPFFPCFLFSTMFDRLKELQVNSSSSIVPVCQRKKAVGLKVTQAKKPSCFFAHFSLPMA